MISPAIEVAPRVANRACSSPASSIRYLSRGQIESLCISSADVIGLVRRAYVEKAHGLIETAPKSEIPIGFDATIRAMRAYLPSHHRAGVKWISAFPRNVAHGLPTISGLIVLSESEHGLPIAVMDATWITAARTAASAALTAQHIARPDSRSIGFIACGQLARMTLEALAPQFPLDTVKAYDVHLDAARRFARDMEPLTGLAIEPVDRIEQAVEGVDILVSSAPILKRPRAPICTAQLERGAAACLLDFDTTLSGDGIGEAARFIVDDMDQLAYYKRLGYLKRVPVPDSDLSFVIAGKLPGRTNAGDTIIAMNLGIAPLDVYLADEVLVRAQDANVGTILPL